MAATAERVAKVLDVAVLCNRCNKCEACKSKRKIAEVNTLQFMDLI